MDQAWFEMADVRRRKLEGAVWIPLRAVDRIRTVAKYGHAGFQEEFYGVGSVAFAIKDKAEAAKLGWSDIGIGHHHTGWVGEQGYVPCDVFDRSPNVSGLHLVLDQRGNAIEHSEWHLHQDFATTLGLKREGDKWLRMEEGYVEVARLTRSESGSPQRIEVRASHLKDYLCARQMALYFTSYRQRTEVFEAAHHIKWTTTPVTEKETDGRWKGRIVEIHEGGMPFGEEMAVMHLSRTNVDTEEDVPALGLPDDANVKLKSWTQKDPGRKLFQVSGELWRNEWIDPAAQSPIVRGDEIPPSVYFVTDAEGKQENRSTLVSGGRWLWFRPDVIPALAHRRGGSLAWHTQDTGDVGCSPGYEVHFGVNTIGLVNVYAKDIAQLPDWQQRIWAGYNISPEGKVSEELLASQAMAEPASTLAPEPFLADGLTRLAVAAKERLGIEILRQHEEIPNVLARAHRFRATDKAGLFALAKDLARLTADSLDAAEMQKLVSPPKNKKGEKEKWASLKSLEELLGTMIDPARAKAMLGPLHGVYNLRLGDAHLPGDLGEAFALLRIDQSAPFVTQGFQMLYWCVSSIQSIARVIQDWKAPNLTV